MAKVEPTPKEERTGGPLAFKGGKPQLGGEQNGDSTIPPVTPEGGEALVNENEAEITQAQRAQALQLALDKANAQNKDLREQNSSLREQLKNDRNTGSSRSFRLYLSVIQGFISRGLLDQSTIAQQKNVKPDEYVKRVLNHAAGIAELAQVATLRADGTPRF